MSQTIQRPFYVYTPRNKYGEPLVNEAYGHPPCEVRAVDTGKKIHATGYDRNLMDKVAGEMNDALAFAMWI